MNTFSIRKMQRSHYRNRKVYNIPNVGLATTLAV
jgi:hypothetical protein